MNESERIANNLRAFMEAKGVASQTELSKRSGVSQTNISNIMRAAVNSQVDTLACLAKALGVETWHLLAPADAISFIVAYTTADSEDRDALLRMATSLAGRPSAPRQ